MIFFFNIYILSSKSKFEEKGTEISENEITQLTKQMETFKTNLQEFAFKYKDEIKRNAEFRKQFQVKKANNFIES